MKKITSLIFFSFLAIILTTLPKTVKAENFNNINYKIDGEIIPGAITPTPEIYKSNPYISSNKKSNYIIQSGYGEKTRPFILQTSQYIIDYGPLTPTNPITRTAIISIRSGPHYGYSLFTYENHPLQYAKNLIPDTSCDNGLCSDDIPAPWTSTLTYGLGYRCDDQKGTGCQTQFQDETEFLQIPKKNIEIMKNIYGGFDQSEITFKLNISGTQTMGIYNNQITYIALPTL